MKRDHDLRHARSGRGDDHGDAHRRDEPRPHRAGRHADGDLPPPGDAFRRELRRLPGHELPAGRPVAAGDGTASARASRTARSSQTDVPASALPAARVRARHPRRALRSRGPGSPATVEVVEHLGERTLVYARARRRRAARLRGRRRQPRCGSATGWPQLRGASIVHLSTRADARHHPAGRDGSDRRHWRRGRPNEPAHEPRARSTRRRRPPHAAQRACSSRPISSSFSC